MVSDGSLVSVIIPTYYRNETLKNSIESVLNQRYEPIEIIVVDDSGEQHARPVTDGYDVTYIYHDSNKGANPARNTGIAEAEGEFVQLLDDDDRLECSKLTKQVELLKNRDGYSVGYCGLRIDDNVILPNPDIEGNVLRHMLKLTHLPCVNSTMLIRRSVLDEITPLADRQGGDDVGMRIELADRTRFDFVNEPLVNMGNTEGSRGMSVSASREYFKIIQEYGDLYDRYPPELRAEARANAFRSLGQALLDQHIWSWEAVKSFAKSCYITPQIKQQHVGLFVGSLLGRPGVTAAKRVKNAI